MADCYFEFYIMYIYIHVHTYYAVDLENFGVKKLFQAHTSMKLKHEIFYYDNYTFE